jgi:branched-chain amino acid aminotransferase
MIEIFKELNLDYSEELVITEEVLREADELMLVNSIKGIRWVIGFEEKRYFNNIIRKISGQFQKRRLS